MENQEKNTGGGTSDLRIFIIALLTAVIVVALYHFGTGYYRMLRGNHLNAAAPCQTVMVPMMPCNVNAPYFHNNRHRGYRNAYEARQQERRGERREIDRRDGRRHFRPGAPEARRPAPPKKRIAPPKALEKDAVPPIPADKPAPPVPPEEAAK